MSHSAQPLDSDFSRIAFNNPTCAAAAAAEESSGNSRRLRGKERVEGGREREGQVCVVVGSPGRAKEVVPVGLKKEEEEESSIFLEVWQIHSGVISFIL